MRTVARASAVALTLLAVAPAGAVADDAAILAAAAKRWAAASELIKQLDKLHAAERESVVKLAAEVGDTAEVRALAGIVVPPALDALNGGSPALDATEAGKKLAAWRRTWGPKWGKLVKLAEKLKRADFAHRFARLALLRDPDQPDARMLLGQVKHQGEWLGPVALDKARAGQVWSSEAGWVAKSDIPRIAAGDLPIDGQWLAKADVIARRSKWSDAWRFETEGWAIRTSVGPQDWSSLRALLAEALALARESFAHRFVFDPGRKIDALILGSSQDFLAHVDEAHDADPSMRAQAGFHDTKDHALHVRWLSMNRSEAASVTVHEGLHAMLGESVEIDGGRLGDRQASFLEEGAAQLFEELSHVARVANSSAEGRWIQAPATALTGPNRMRLREAVGASPLSHPEQAKLYTHARAAARFLYGHPDPRRFEALKEYVALTHQNLAHPDLFPKLCGTTWEQLETEWNAFCDELVKNPNHGRPEPLTFAR